MADDPPVTNLARVEVIFHQILVHSRRIGWERREEIYLRIRDAINQTFHRRLRLCQYRAIRYRTIRQHTQLLRELRALPRRHGPAKAAAFFAHLPNKLQCWVVELVSDNKDII